MIHWQGRTREAPLQQYQGNMTIKMIMMMMTMMKTNDEVCHSNRIVHHILPGVMKSCLYCQGHTIKQIPTTF